MANLDRADEAARASTSAGTDDWATEELWWRENYASRPYVRADMPFDYYSPAYRYGYESAGRYGSRDWSDAQEELESGWSSARGAASSTWQDVKDAVKDAWDHVRGNEHSRHRSSTDTIRVDERF